MIEIINGVPYEVDAPFVNIPDTGFYIVYDDVADLSKFKYKMRAPEGLWEVDYERFNFERSVKNNPGILICSGNACIYIVDNVPIINLLAVKRKQNELISACFQEEMDGGFSWEFDGNAVMVDSKRVDSDNYKSLLYVLEHEGNGITEAPVKNNNGDTIIINATQLRQMINDLLLWGMSLYSKKWNLESLIDNAVNYSEIISIVW